MKRRRLARLSVSVGPICPEQLPGIRTWRIRAKVLKVFGLHANFAHLSAASQEGRARIEPDKSRCRTTWDVCRNFGWEAGIRTPITASRAPCPTVERPPSTVGRGRISNSRGRPAVEQPRRRTGGHSRAAGSLERCRHRRRLSRPGFTPVPRWRRGPAPARCAAARAVRPLRSPLRPVRPHPTARRRSASRGGRLRKSRPGP